METIVRPIKIKDWRDVAKYLFIKSSPKEVKEGITQDLKDMAVNKKLVCVVEVDIKVVGICSFSKPNSPIKQHLVEITGAVVNEKYRGKGYFSKMIKFGINWAEQNGAIMTVISVRKGTDAEKIYRHMGFIQYGELPEGIKEPWGNKETFDEIMFYRQI